jgi:hypothetical protein
VQDRAYLCPTGASQNLSSYDYFLVEKSLFGTCDIPGTISRDCSHILEKCPNCKHNHIGFSNRCAKSAEAANTAWQSRGMRPVEWASANAATGVALGSNRVMLRHKPKGTGNAAGGSGAELVVAEDEEATGKAEDITMTESATTAVT